MVVEKANNKLVLVWSLTLSVLRCGNRGSSREGYELLKSMVVGEDDRQMRVWEKGVSFIEKTTVITNTELGNEIGYGCKF
jgi:hypothetical protein